MDYYLTETTLMVGGAALLLIIVFALAAFLDSYWKRAAPPRVLHSELESRFLPQGPDSHEVSESTETFHI